MYTELQEQADHIIGLYLRKLKEDFGYTVQLGAEIEFIALGEMLDMEEVQESLKQNAPSVSHLKREWKCGVIFDKKTGQTEQFELPGVYQYEIVTTKENDPFIIADTIRGCRQHLESYEHSGLQVAFGPRPVQDTAPYLAKTRIPKGKGKPNEKVSGNGLHLNISLLDENGNNVFFNSSTIGESQIFRAAAAGVLDFVQNGGTLPFCMHGESYARLGDEDYDAPARAEISILKHGGGILRPSPYAEQVIKYGIYNSKGIKIDRAYGDKEGNFEYRDLDGSNFRMEIRLADAMAEPSLIIASALAAIYDGLKKHKEISSHALQEMTKELPGNLRQSAQAFNASQQMRELLGETLHSLLGQNVAQELFDSPEVSSHLERLANQRSTAETQLYR